MSGDRAEEDRFVIVADARRRWTPAQKRSIVAECDRGTASVSSVARKHNIAPNLLFRWRREFSMAKPPVGAKPGFVPVALPAVSVAEGPAAVAARAAEQPVSSIRSGGLIEIELVGGRRLRVDGAVNGDALRRVIEVL
jgi:transposase